MTAIDDGRFGGNAMIGKTLYCVCAIALPFAVSAQELPKQGTANFTDYAMIVSPKTMTMGKDSRVTNYEVYGVSRNDDGNPIFNNMAIHCMGSIITADNHAVSRGLCVQSDKDGDQLFINYETGGSSADASVYGGIEHFTGGTGKYAGITGQAELTRQIVNAPDNTRMLILPHKARWTKP
jgi:hypothetical protein